MDFEVGAGNLHDGLLFHELYKKMDLNRTQIVAVDAGYKTPVVVREIFKSGKIPAYTRSMTKDGFSENLNMFTMKISTVIFVRRIKY